jgi:pimeloyl-ACP methyl ester carboxylesterase
MPKKTAIKASNTRGFIRVITKAIISITDLVEDLHHRIVHTKSVPSSPIQHIISGIAGFTFNNVRTTATLIGNGLDKTLELLNPLLDVEIPSEKKETALAIINGVIGDYLGENKNPLAIQMQIRYKSQNISFEKLNETYSNLNGKIMLMIHGLCMNDLQWTRNEHNHGELLAKQFNFTPIYLHYNSGLHISANGKELNSVLNELTKSWPVPMEEIVILSHSMGGLVARSAYYYGQEQNKSWTKHLKKIIFLGTPHHGAPLERAGNFIEELLETNTFAKPFARLGKMRSSGITDLRYGNIVDNDWQGIDRFKKLADNRKQIPLLEKVQSYAVAAAIGKKEDFLKYKIIGDGLVPIESALGNHKNTDKNLNFPESNTLIIYESNHMDLLSSMIVYNKIQVWMTE